MNCSFSSFTDCRGKQKNREGETLVLKKNV